MRSLVSTTSPRETFERVTTSPRFFLCGRCAGGGWLITNQLPQRDWLWPNTGDVIDPTFSLIPTADRFFFVGAEVGHLPLRYRWVKMIGVRGSIGKMSLNGNDFIETWCPASITRRASPSGGLSGVPETKPDCRNPSSFVLLCRCDPVRRSDWCFGCRQGYCR